MTPAQIQAALVPQQLSFSLDALPGRLTATGLTLDADLTFAQWRAVGAQLSRVHGAMLWWVGDWLRYGEQNYGQTYTAAIEATGYDYQTAANAKYVAEAVEFSRRRESLSWSHHAEVAALTPVDQDRWLDWATSTAPAQSRQDLRKALRAEKRQQADDAAGPLPEGVFDVILADPPWAYDNQIASWGPTSLHYDAIPTEELKTLPVVDRAAVDATLFLWATNPFLGDALDLAAAWGFTYRTNIVWVKRDLRRPGSGFYVRGHHELLFICTRGAHVPDQSGKEPVSSVLEAPVGAHSEKPETSYALIEALYPEARRLELFSRRPRDGWIPWGHLG